MKVTINISDGAYDLIQRSMNLLNTDERSFFISSIALYTYLAELIANNHTEIKIFSDVDGSIRVQEIL